MLSTTCSSVDLILVLEQLRCGVFRADRRSSCFFSDADFLATGVFLGVAAFLGVGAMSQSQMVQRWWGKTADGRREEAAGRMLR